MSIETTAAKDQEPKARKRQAQSVPLASGFASAGPVILLLGLTFLLGVFPLKDTDFWWHLRTGDLIRKTGVVPHRDLYTFTVPDHEWIDLHWGFEVVLSRLYQLGGVDATTLAKCVVTTLGMAILLTTRKRGWPTWVMVVAWLPALYVLSGRMYVRPETATFLYITIFLTVIFRWHGRPWLAFILPIAEILWVNTQGLFILGLVILTFGLADSAFTRRLNEPEDRRWWAIVLSASVLTGLAALANPYFIKGALFPISLIKTMGSPIFEEKIAELTPVLTFIKRTGGFNNLPLQVHIATIVVGR